MGRLIEPQAGRLDREFTRLLRGQDYAPLAVRALVAITPAAASRLRRFDRFLEQVEYNGRRLAKLNVPVSQVQQALRDFAGLLDRVLGGRFQPAREQLELAVVLALNRAYYQVREAETQALFGIYRAELEAGGFGDLLRRFVRILTPALHARAGRIVALDAPLDRRLAKPRYIERACAVESLIADGGMRGRYESYWSYPLGGCLVAQFGFAVKYPWLPRELALLEAAAERCRAAAERDRLETENRRLEAQARDAQEAERRRIGRELHDEAGQSLLLLRLQLEMMERDAPVQLREQVAAARGVAESAVTEIRRIVAALGPAVLERLGLLAALRHLGGRFSKMHAASLALRLPRRIPPLASGTEEAIYRVAQESLLNIAKHSHAKSVKVSLHIADSVIRLSVCDDGAGFREEDATRSGLAFGLAGMRTRALLLGGKLDAVSAPGKGVTVKLELPLAAPRKSNGKNSRTTD